MALYEFCIIIIIIIVITHGHTQRRCGLCWKKVTHMCGASLRFLKCSKVFHRVDTGYSVLLLYTGIVCYK